ncbi:hypothetical protein E1B28_001636 [Marasmius oreades]|uniref:Uncharacterized protein n=1 Tax=Marasmius oreades TaxID=181124 RepID=A0A9P7V3Y7_9AGAR|nr:uncharacterized protein E1B28_001636 [Marasmius oreades]KAG7099828.1 hypothetical protein E1B28_001636 [Marasmius oreades]
MKFFAFATIAAIATSVQAQNLVINTPVNLVECKPALLTWAGGKGDVVDGNNPSGPPIERFPEQEGTSLIWVVDAHAGQSVGLLVRDSKGATSQTAPVIVQAGTGPNCHA